MYDALVLVGKPFRVFVGSKRVSKLDIHREMDGSLTRLDMMDWKDGDVPCGDESNPTSSWRIAR